MARLTVTVSLPPEVYTTFLHQAQIEGKVISRWMTEVCRDRIRAMGKLMPDELVPIAQSSRAKELFEGQGVEPLVPAIHQADELASRALEE